MSSKIALFSETDSNDYTILRFQEEARKLDLELKHIKYSDLKLTFDKEVKVIQTQSNLDVVDYFDYFIFRSSIDKNKRAFGHFGEVIKQLALKKGKRVFNNKNQGVTVSNTAIKINNYATLALDQIPIIKSISLGSISQLKEIINTFTFPLIAKHANGSHGQGVNLINTKEDLLIFFEGEPINLYLIQEFIESSSDKKEDLRIITLGDKVVGAYKKTAPKDSIVTNIASGGNAESIEMTPDIVELGEKVIKAMQLEFSGIDAIYKGNDLLVLEVNKAPQFEGFEAATGINLAKMILEYLTS